METGVTGVAGQLVAGPVQEDPNQGTCSMKKGYVSGC